MFVVLFHLQINGFANGFLGVDVFFVISGFLMALLFDKGTKCDFYIRRIKRLVPAYAATVFLVLLVPAFYVLPVDYSQLVSQSLAAGSFSSNVFYWTQNSYFSKAEFNPLLNLWSLGVEAQFYLLVPFLFPLLKNRNWLTIFAGLMSLLCCIGIASISPKTAFFHMPFRVWEFLIGAYIAWNFADYFAKTNKSEKLQYSLLCIFILCFFLPISPNSKVLGLGQPGLIALIVSSLTGALLVSGMPASFQNGKVGIVLVTIGKYSYSIYLVHFPIIVLYNYQAFGGTRLGYDDIQSLITLIVLIAIASVLMFHLVERQNKSIFQMKMRLCFVCLAIGIMAPVLNSRSYSKEQTNIFSAWQDRSAYRCGKIFRILNPTKHICELTGLRSDNNKKVLLVGNSHADAIKHSFANIAKSQNIKVFFYVPNDPLINKNIDGKHVLKDALDLSVDAVVIHFNDRYDDEGFIKRLGVLLVGLDDNSIKSYVIEPVPTYAQHIPKYMYSVTIGGEENLSNQTLQDHRQSKAAFWKAVPLLTKNPNEIIRTADDLCNPTCQYSDQDGRPYYFDSGHLTHTGARLLEPKFHTMLSDIFTYAQEK